jgi:uncharacterized RDD family membrane protein YckC
MNREGFFIRAGACLLDVVFCLVPALVLTFVAAAATGPWLAGVLSAGVFVAYSTLEIFKGATFGKTILKLKICNEDGTEANRAALLKRWAIKNSAWLFYFVAALTSLRFINYFGSFAGIAFCISALLTFKAQRQTLHDTLTQTGVYKTQAAAAPAQAAPAIPEPHKQAA